MHIFITHYCILLLLCLFSIIKRNTFRMKVWTFNNWMDIFLNIIETPGPVHAQLSNNKYQLCTVRHNRLIKCRPLWQKTWIHINNLEPLFWLSRQEISCPTGLGPLDFVFRQVKHWYRFATMGKWTCTEILLWSVSIPVNLKKPPFWVLWQIHFNFGSVILKLCLCPVI